MAEVINDVRVLVEATEGADEFEPIDFGDAVRDAVSTFHATYDGVAVDASAPSGVFVAADDLLPRVFSNLFTNAVELRETGPEGSVFAVELPRTSVPVSDPSADEPADSSASEANPDTFVPSVGSESV